MNRPIALLPPPTQAIARSGHVGPRLPLELEARLVADHPVEVAHHAREGVGAEHRAEHVVGGADVGHPVAHRLVDGVLERAAAGVDGHHLGAEQAHAVDVEPLAAHVLAAHVDDAGEAERRRGGGGGHAVLAGAGLGDHPLLAHQPGEQALAEGVVDLVRAGVEQVLALEEDAGAAQLLGQALGEVERRRPAGEVVEQAGQLAAEAPRSAAPCRRRGSARPAAPSASRGRSGRRSGRSNPPGQEGVGVSPCSSPPERAAAAAPDP